MSPHAAQTANASKTDEASPFAQLMATAVPQEKKPAQNEARADKPVDDKSATPAQDVRTETNAAPSQTTAQDSSASQDITDEKPVVADITADAESVIDAPAGDPALITQPVTQSVVQPAAVVVPVQIAAANDDAAPEDLIAAQPADAEKPSAPFAAPQAAAPTDVKPAPQANAEQKIPQDASLVTENQAAESAPRKPQQDFAENGATDDVPADPAKSNLTQAANIETAAPKAPPQAAQPAPGTNMAVHTAQQPMAAAAPAAMAEFTRHVEVSAEAPRPNMPSLAVEIAAKSLSGARQFDIRLDPPELGRVEVRLSIDAAGKASAHLSADQPQTLDLLQRDASVLTRALRDAGLDVSQNSLNFSLRHQSHDGGAHNGHARGPSRGTTLTATSSVEATPVSASMRGDGRLDIRV